MLYLFYFFGIISIISTTLVIIQNRPMYALLYLIISFLSITGIFFLLGSFFAAALEIIIYTGAIMLLFVFVIMLLNFKNKLITQKIKWIQFVCWGRGLYLFITFVVVMVYILSSTENKYNLLNIVIDTKTVGIDLFNSYSLIVEMSSMLLLAGLVVVFHLGQ
ncbi:NADH-ubiquinone oxidoreductase chain J [Buchnera aphidicola (Nipponaphis monzeni)]|uniref:NADH-quinone oxidoreductase subunit J n=1 Tax=Buchnera aphidicola (Nipponaphis monzeni) TaxID=2495405 RepID=A0A455TA04_9GAMM|nr:NADH-quinone oxidoreductase subunit J [Buchnera aphidicola]BBI01145.1 NADH-ubiquinone oxidoreductase chain J [Buchnera aphidicola (Nipponaphis monzeni)]